jgi:hypothetical protein
MTTVREDRCNNAERCMHTNLWLAARWPTLSQHSSQLDPQVELLYYKHFLAVYMKRIINFCFSTEQQALPLL